MRLSGCAFWLAGILFLASCGQAAAEEQVQLAASTDASRAQSAATQEPSDKLSSAELDELVIAELDGAALPAAVSDEQFLRRASLDLIGRQPMAAELEAFAADARPEKRSQAIERLLAMPGFGQNWANYWSDTIGFRVPQPELTFLDYKPLEGWLAGKLNEGRPWDEIVREVLVAGGKVKDNPAASFVGFHEASPTRLAAETSRIFMGVAIQCAECHDHPFDEWKREQFHELAAFFARIEAKAPHNDSLAIDVKSKDKGEHRMPDMKDPGKKGPEMTPVLFTAGQSPGAGKSDAERRKALAGWITEPGNPWFARAYTNRLWERLMGRGFYEPVDNIGGSQDGQLLAVHEKLSESFVAGGYDVKAMFRLVMNTQAYQRGLSLEAESPFADVTDKISGDQVFDSLAVAIELPNFTPPATKPTEAVRFPPPPKNTRDLVSETFGFDPSLPAEEVCRTMGQAMMMMNAEQLQVQIQAEPETGTMLAKLLTEEASDEQAIVKLFQRVLGRRPSDAEVKISLEHLGQAASRGEGFEDLLWGLLNSAEFTTKR